jgi:hypothetical protein
MRVRFTCRPRQSRFSSPDARPHDPGVAPSASQCCLMPIERRSSFLGRVSIRCSPHSPLGLRRLVSAPRFSSEAGLWAIGRRDGAATPRNLSAQTTARPRLRGGHAAGLRQNRRSARAVDCRFLRLNVLGRVIAVNARRTCPLAGPNQLEKLRDLIGNVESSRARS